MHIKLLKTDSTYYDLSANFISVGMSRGDQTRETDTFERSANDGAQKIGETRIASAIIMMSVEVDQPSDTLYRSVVNGLYKELVQTEYLEDTDNDIRTRVELQTFTEEPDNEIGSVMRGGRLNFEFKQLTPYWEDATENSETGSGTNPVISVTNNGALPTQPTVELTVSGLCENVAVYVNSNKEGIEINDLSFGSAADLYDYTINCFEGTIELGDNNLDRNNRIRTNTGFFTIPIGTQQIDVLTDVSITAVIKWRNRYLI